jgi:hypothetical protein
MQFTSDTFWKTVFEDLAYGKTPYGAYISKDFLCCGYKDKDFSYKIERKDPKKVYDEVYHLFHRRLGILSSKERNKRKIDFNKIEEDVQDDKKKWSDIKKKNIKDLLIEMYVIKMQKKHSLSVKQARYLLSLIFIAMVFKVITSKDIHYTNGEIQNIDGINFSKHKFIFDRNIYTIDKGCSPEIILDQNQMSKKWEKHLENLKKTVVY